MGLTQKLGVRGLYTNPNPLGAPDGALLEASEVVFRRPQLAEPRPGFKAGSSSSLASLYALFAYDGRIIRVGPDVGGTTGSTTYRYDGTVAILDSNATSPVPDALQWDRDAMRALETRGNLYMTTKDGVRRIEDGGNVVSPALRAGLTPPSITAVSASGTSGFLLSGYRASYRLVRKRTDNNGVITRSAPSGRMVATSATAGATASLTYSWHSPDGYSATDVIEVYRSEAANGLDPDDTHYLIAEVSILLGLNASSNGGTYTISDAASEDLLGLALYTNDTTVNGSSAAAAFRPPACTDLALYQGSVFWSGITDYARKTVTFFTDQDKSGSTTGIGYRLATGTRTHNSNTITGLSSVTGLKVGMMLIDATNWSGSGPVVISAIVGSDVSMTSNYTGSTDGAPAALVLADAICIGATNNPANYYRADLPGYLISGVLDGSDATHGRMTQNATVFAYATGKVNGSGNAGATIATFEAFSALDSFTISATHGSEYIPALLEPSVTPETVAPESLPNVIGWSQRDQPEYRQLADRLYVGNSSPILRIFGTKDAVWIVKGKGDGVYRLSGMGAETGFRLDQSDQSTYLLHANLACQLGETAYGWTNNGLVSIDDGGVIPISDPVIGADTHALEVALDHESGDNLACLAVANPKDNEVIFGLPPASLSSSPDATERTYVYNTLTRGLSQWFVGNTTHRCAAYDTATRALLFGKNDSGTYRVERLPSETYVQFADREFSLTISGVSGNVVTLTGAVSGWTPVAGDLVRQSTAFAIITAVTSSTVFTVSDGSVLASGAGASYEGFTSRVRWNPDVEGAPAALKRFSETILHFEDVYGVEEFTSKVDSSRSYGTAVSTTRSITFARTHAPLDKRTLVSRSHTMASRLYPTFEIAQADSRWALSGISFVSETLTTRLHR